MVGKNPITSGFEIIQTSTKVEQIQINYQTFNSIKCIIKTLRDTDKREIYTLGSLCKSPLENIVFFCNPMMEMLDKPGEEMIMYLNSIS